jgi:hypothetical protein
MSCRLQGSIVYEGELVVFIYGAEIKRWRNIRQIFLKFRTYVGGKSFSSSQLGHGNKRDKTPTLLYASYLDLDLGTCNLRKLLYYVGEKISIHFLME